MAEILATVLVGIITGAVGGFTANFLANWVWRRYKEPDLQITGGVEKFYHINSQDELVEIYYRVPVQNVGKTAARNCKPEIDFKGEAEYTDTDRRHKIENPVCWSEKDKPARITINPGEIATFDIFKQDFKDNTGAVSFPSEKGWTETAPIVVQWINPESVQGVTYSEPQNLERGKGMNRITKEKFVAMKWETQTVEVTAENVEKVERYLQVDDAGEELYVNVVSTT